MDLAPSVPAPPSRPPIALRKLVLTVPIPDDLLSGLRDRFPGIDIVGTTDDELDAHLGGMDAYAGFSISPERIARATELRWIQLMSAGVEHVASPALAGRGIALTNASGVHAANIGEHVLAMMLTFARQLHLLQRDQIAHRWRDTWIRDRVFELDDQKLVVVGFGAIGRAVAARALAFGMRVVGVRRRADGETPEGVDRVVPFEQLSAEIADADHVVICLPLTPATRGMFDAGMLGGMKPGSHIYNIGRGGIIDQDALIAALSTGAIAGAGLDVTTPEPLPTDSPLWDMDSVLITAHTSGGTPRYWRRAVVILADNIERITTGRPLVNEVDVEAGY